MAIGDIITAARYNSMRNILHTVLGTNNSGTSGYGQYVLSATKAVDTEVSHADMIDLYIDMYRARAHQTGNPPVWTRAFEGLNFPETGDIIGEFAAAISDGNSSNATVKVDMGYVDYELAMDDVQLDAITFASSQMSQEVFATDTRTSIWNGSIIHIFTVTFDGYTLTLPNGSTQTVSGEDHRRYFFNTGGNIQFEANLIGGLSGTSGTKDYDWSVMLSNMGTITFGSLSTTASGTGTGSSLGNFNISTVYQTVFQKSGSGVYAENDYTIRARSPSPNQIQFEVSFNDDDTGDEPITPVPPGGIVGGVDENVQGQTNSLINILRADGDSLTIDGTVYDGVSIPKPTYTANSSLSSAPVPVITPPAPPPPPEPVPTSDNAICVSVIDESSMSETQIREDWLQFRNNYPNRTFWLLQPQRFTEEENLKEPVEFTQDVLAFKTKVSQDNGNVAARSDWFDVMGLSTLPAGTLISLAIDNSGSITPSKVQASYDLFLVRCASAGFQVSEAAMYSERWAVPHDRSVP